MNEWLGRTTQLCPYTLCRAALFHQHNVELINVCNMLLCHLDTALYTNAHYLHTLLCILINKRTLPLHLVFSLLRFQGRNVWRKLYSGKLRKGLS